VEGEKHMTRLDLEDKISKTWMTSEDIDLLYRQVLDAKNPLDNNDIANVLLGIKSLHDLRCQETWDCFIKVFELDSYDNI
jgi:hypothetical protein